MDKTRADKFMYIPNDYTQNYNFCKLQLVIEAFEHSTKWNQPIKIQLKLIKVPKVTNKKTYL